MVCQTLLFTQPVVANRRTACEYHVSNSASFTTRVMLRPEWLESQKNTEHSGYGIGNGTPRARL